MESKIKSILVATGLAVVSVAMGSPDASPAASRAIEIVLPPDTVFFAPSPLKGFAAAQSNCVVCHSTEYIRSQPTLTRATWKAEVSKMKNAFGAPIPDDQIELIVDYLAQTYGSGGSSPFGPRPSTPKQDAGSRAP